MSTKFVPIMDVSNGMDDPKKQKLYYPKMIVIDQPLDPQERNLETL